MLGVLDSVRDESNEKAHVRIVLEPRTSKISQQEFMAVLLAHTSLESSVSVNMTMIGHGKEGGRPKQKALLTILHEWIEFRHATVERRSRHRLNEVERRLHILEGRLAVFLQIEKVIRCIRESDEPKTDLMAKFKLTEIQAEDILEIRLRQLARLEGIKIEKERGELRDEETGLRKILGDRKELTKLVVKEITEDAKKYGDDRRTLIEAEAATATAEVAILDEPVTVIVSQNGWVRARQGHGLDPNTISYKAGDYPFLIAESRTVWPLAIVDTQGRAYSVRVADLPGGRGDGVPLTTLIEFQDGAKLVQALTDAPEARYVFANSGGYGFIASVADLVSRQRAGKAFMSLDKNEKPIAPAKVSRGVTGGNPRGSTAPQILAAISQTGRLLVFPLDELKVMAKGRGLIIQDIAPKDELVAVAVGDGSAFTVLGAGRAGKATEWSVARKELTPYRGSRARKGQAIPARLKPSGLAGQ
jgi:topoisomerase-4 subunit A